MVKGWSILLAFVLIAGAACSTGPPDKVSSQVIGDDTTQEIRVWAPVGHGSWPVVYALPGISGHKSDFDLLGPALARRGVVVFATDYRTDGGLQDVANDMACGYRYVRRVAHEYGGDLRQPVTGVGYSFGAKWMLAGALQRPAGGDSRADACGQKLPLPDVVVGVNGCYYHRQDPPPGFAVDALDRRQAGVALVAASADRTCPAWHSKKAAASLRAAGFHATLTMIRGANHYTPVFHDVVDGKWVSVPEDVAGERTVRAILDAIKANS